MSGTDETMPVVIAGAGPVGLTLALSLARRGVRTLVLEKKRELDRKSRATLIVPGALEIFEALGVLPAFLEQGQRNDAIRILRAPERAPFLAFDFAPLAGRTSTPFALALAQDRTERILLAAVQDTGLAEVAFGRAFEAYEPIEGGLRVRVSDGTTMRTRWLVGADGAHSAVRDQLGWTLEGKTYPTRAFLADVVIDPARDLDRGWLADPKAPSFTIAVRFGDGTWRLIESAIPDEVAETDFQYRARRLTDTLFGAGAWRDTLWTAAYRKHERRAARYRQGRVALAGDAAHLNSPAGGQGMNAGVQDADLLARALADARERPADAGQLLDAYEAKRIAAFDDHVRPLTDGIERMETAPAWLRSLAFSAVGLAQAAGVEALIARKLSLLDAR